VISKWSGCNEKNRKKRRRNWLKLKKTDQIHEQAERSHKGAWETVMNDENRRDAQAKREAALFIKAQRFQAEKHCTNEQDDMHAMHNAPNPKG